jgi:O-phospho-L-seryl-tRNASec:L-selenocysteinyl-tRNA synthase
LLKKTKIPENIIKRGLVSLGSFLKPMEDLLNQLKPPENGWRDDQIKFFLEILAHMDSNNDPSSFQIGEREGRISTPLLYDLTAGFIHGVGRSGNIKAPQPKATGGSIVNNITDRLVTFFLKEMGLENIRGSIVVPLSTGMSLMLAIKGIVNKYKLDLNTDQNEIIFPRIDHKSPIKAIDLTGKIRITVDTITGHEYIADLSSKLEKSKIKEYQIDVLKMYQAELEFVRKFGLDSVYVPVGNIKEKINKKTLAIVSTTTFFPPRAPDNVKEIAKIAKKHNLIHIINNAYGVQSRNIMKLIRGAIDAGRVDAIIQSTDKNFLTPIGGTIISAPDKLNLNHIAEAYAGRGSAAPVLHLLVSLLSLGINGYMNYVKIQEENRILLENELRKIANQIGEKVLDVNNPIACMMTLSTLNNEKKIERLGGFLYNLRVTGPRVVNSKINKFGPCTDNYPYPYIVMNSAIGVKREDILGAVSQLKKAFKQLDIK